MGWIEWVMRFRGQCGYCGKELKKGAKFFREPDLQKFACKSCQKSLKKGIEPVIALSPAQQVVDQVRRLDTLRTRNSEVEQLLGELRTTYAADQAAIKFLQEYYGLGSGIVVICNKYRGKCATCKIEHAPGIAVAWDTGEHRIWCLECASP